MDKEDKTTCIRIARFDGDFRLPRKVSYRVMIGTCESDTFCVGEARATRFNDRYLLESTKDSRHPYDPSDREDKRRFEILGPGIVDNEEDAERVLHDYAKNWAGLIQKVTGLKIIDYRFDNKVEKQSKDEEPISIDDKI